MRSALTLILMLAASFVGMPLAAQSRQQFRACLDAVSQRFGPASDELNANPGPIRNGNSIILWETRSGARMNGYCEVTSNNRVVNLDRGNYDGNNFGGGNFGNNRPPDG